MLSNSGLTWKLIFSTKIWNLERSYSKVVNPEATVDKVFVQRRWTLKEDRVLHLAHKYFCHCSFQFSGQPCRESQRTTKGHFAGKTKAQPYKCSIVICTQINVEIYCTFFYQECVIALGGMFHYTYRKVKLIVPTNTTIISILYTDVLIKNEC